MKISFWAIGKSHEEYIRPGVEDFTRRVSKYFPVDWHVVPPLKNAASLSEPELKKKEADTIIQILPRQCFLVALDENGKQFTSHELAGFIQQRATESAKHVVFLIGGAYGLHDDVLQLAKLKWSLSRLTFPHQLVRLILAEQIYRACTILHNEKYHHQ